jgi:ketosteroid isomerase-like protein
VGEPVVISKNPMGEVRVVRVAGRGLLPVGVTGDTAQTMSQENVEIVRRTIEGNRSDNLAAVDEDVVALADPAVEFRSALTGLEGGAYHGHEGIRRYFTEMAESWREWHNDPAEIEEIAPDTVLSTFIFRAIGKESGVAVERHTFVVWVLKDARVLRATTFASRAEALEAVGLSE